MDSGDDDHHHLCGCDPACACCCSDRFSWLLFRQPLICGGADAAVSSSPNATSHRTCTFSPNVTSHRNPRSPASTTLGRRQTVSRRQTVRRSRRERSRRSSIDVIDLQQRSPHRRFRRGVATLVMRATARINARLTDETSRSTSLILKCGDPVCRPIRLLSTWPALPTSGSQSQGVVLRAFKATRHPHLGPIP